MKTLTQLLSHPDLPKEIRHEILAEMERQGISEETECLDVLLYNFIENPISFCYWGDAEKGCNYWYNTFLKLKALGI